MVALEEDEIAMCMYCNSDYDCDEYHKRTDMVKEKRMTYIRLAFWIAVVLAFIFGKITGSLAIFVCLAAIAEITLILLNRK
jgi:hypothetical protein